MKKKISHFNREPLKVVKQYSDEELDKRWLIESDFQREALRFIYCIVHPDELVEVIHLPGGSANVGRRKGGELKLDGARAGVSDLMILWRQGCIAFIELKAKSATSLAQKEFLTFLELSGHNGVVCKTLREIMAFILRLGIPLRV